MVGAGHALGNILDELDENSAAPSCGMVYNAVASIYFVNKDYNGAVNYFNKCLSFTHEKLSPLQKAGILCNAGSAYYKLNNRKQCKNKFCEALMLSESVDEISSKIRAIIMCKLAYILYNHEDYGKAYNLYTQGKSGGKVI